MLRHTKDLLGSAVEAADGSIGEVVDLLFDDHSWTVRSLVVKTGEWLTGRRDVLISPISIRTDSTSGKTIQTSLRREQVRASPDVDTRKPISRQKSSSTVTTAIRTTGVAAVCGARACSRP